MSIKSNPGMEREGLELIVCYAAKLASKSKAFTAEGAEFI